MAALFPDRLSLDAAELLAGKAMEIDAAAVALIRSRMGSGKLKRETVRTALDEAARKRR